MDMCGSITLEENEMNVWIVRENGWIRQMYVGDYPPEKIMYGTQVYYLHSVHRGDNQPDIIRTNFGHKIGCWYEEKVGNKRETKIPLYLSKLI
jgi:hypothetical protein